MKTVIYQKISKVECMSTNCAYTSTTGTAHIPDLPGTFCPAASNVGVKCKCAN